MLFELCSPPGRHQRQKEEATWRLGTCPFRRVTHATTNACVGHFVAVIDPCSARLVEGGGASG